MGKYSKIKVGEKLPGTYCPVCGEVGLRKQVFDNVEWAMCPMDANMQAVVTTLKDTHTGYKLDPGDAAENVAPKPTPVSELTPDPEIKKDNKGVNDA